MVKLQVIFGDEDIIIVNAEDGVEVLYWHEDEWHEDPDVVFSIGNAIRMAYQEPEKLFNMHKSHYEAAKEAGYIYT